MSKTFVIAGNRQQADHWIKGNLEKRLQSGITTLSMSDYVVVTDANRLRGISNPHGVFVGTWKDRVDIKDIVETLMIQSTVGNPALGKIWREVKDRVKPTPKKVFVGRGITGVWLDEYSDSVKQAADSLSKEIDDEVLRIIAMKVNSGAPK